MNIKNPPPFVRCIAISAILLLGIALTTFFLVPRQPTTTIYTIELDADSSSHPVTINSLTSVTARLKMGLRMKNNCWYPVTFNALNFKATNPNYDGGKTPFANGQNATGFTIPAQSAVNFTYPFSITYDVSKDQGLQFAGVLGVTCVTGLLGGHGSIGVDLAVDAQYNALGFTDLWQSSSQHLDLSC
ncbi:hypothetical protein BC830DRAFT_1229652 [Chytriomyces sp. MP71]|nr:hypothetical protein BC830DRAFT_1229652 [Chytriomyces sp. MP71]